MYLRERRHISTSELIVLETATHCGPCDLSRNGPGLSLAGNTQCPRYKSVKTSPTLELVTVNSMSQVCFSFILAYCASLPQLPLPREKLGHISVPGLIQGFLNYYIYFSPNNRVARGNRFTFPLKHDTLHTMINVDTNEHSGSLSQ